MAEKVVAVYGEGDGKKHSVRMTPVNVEVFPIENPPTVTLTSPGFGDLYVSREIMKTLGLKDSDRVKVTFEKA